jgi:hypothetical protein
MNNCGSVYYILLSELFWVLKFFKIALPQMNETKMFPSTENLLVKPTVGPFCHKWFLEHFSVYSCAVCYDLFGWSPSMVPSCRGTFCEAEEELLFHIWIFQSYMKL